MKDIRNLNIWKKEEKPTNHEVFLNTDITELNLSVRSFNCLKRVNCNTIQDVLNCMREEGQGLRKIRNLGSRSENEIVERIREYQEACAIQYNTSAKNKVKIAKPARSIWERNIEEFGLSNFSLSKLRDSGIMKIGDLYATNCQKELGWYAVRELFEKIQSCR